MRSTTLLAAAFIVAGSAGAYDLTPPIGVVSEAYPVVLTPTRLRQPLTDVPASVTVIRSETIERYGITSVHDALRLVPGMAVTEAAGSDVRVNYHGTNILTPRRMNVQIDGVSVYQPAFARVDWTNLPVAVEDIERIEVTRSPNSAAYGPNSMLAIVNIITRHPKDVGPAMVSTTIGTRGVVNVTGRAATTLGPTALRLTASHARTGGYDRLQQSAGDHDSTRLDRLNVRSQTRLDRSTTFDLDAAYVGGIKEVAAVEQFQATFPDQRVNDYYLSGTWRREMSPRHDLQVRASYWSNSVRQAWTSCVPTALVLPEMFDLWQASPRYALLLASGRAPSGGSAADDALAAAALAAIKTLGPRAMQPTCGSPNQDLDESRADAELQDTYVVSDRLRVVSGLGARSQRGKSQTYLGGAASNFIWRAFANVEFKPAYWATLNAGAYMQHDSMSGSTISPRAAVNLRLSDSQTLRAAWSMGARSPDIQEQRANWSYSQLTPNPPLPQGGTVRFFQSARSPGNLRSERIVSKEIGYLLHVPVVGLMLDVKVFDDRLTDLISEKLQLSSFSPTNGNSVRLIGGELQASVELSPEWSGFLSYAHLLNKDATTVLERTQYSKHSGAVGLSHLVGDGWRWSVAYYGSSGNGLGEHRYGRTDLTISKAAVVKSSKVLTSLTIQRLDDKKSTYFRDFGNTPSSSYDSRFQLLGSVRINF